MHLHSLQSLKISSVPCLSQLHLYECDLTNSDILPLFQLISAAGSVQKLILNGNNLQGLQPEEITAVPSLVELHLYDCGLTKIDIQPVFSLLSATGSVKTLVFEGNHLQGLQPEEITAVSSLTELRRNECGLNRHDIDSLFTILSSAGSIKTLTLKGNKLNGLQSATITTCPSLSELNLCECGLTSSDIKPLFRLLSAAGRLKKLVLKGDKLHDRKPSQITAVPSLSELHLDECGLTNSDIKPLFSLMSAAGSVKTLALKGNNLHGLQPKGITAVSSLTELHLDECGLTKSDIKPLFSLMSAAGSVKTLALKENKLQGLHPEGITAVSSLTELHLDECGLTKSDIRPLFSLLAAAGSIETLDLQGNNLHGLQPEGITAVSSLTELHLDDCGLTNSDIKPLFSLLAAAGSIKTLALKGINLHGLHPEEITVVPTLSKLHLHGCGLENIDIGPLFSIMSAAGSVETLVLEGRNLHSLQSGKISAVPCLSQLHLYECDLTNSDILPLFQLISAAGSVQKLILNGNNLQGLQPKEITAVPFLVELHLYDCGLTKIDIQPVFSLLSAAGSQQAAYGHLFFKETIYTVDIRRRSLLFPPYLNFISMSAA
ncbi:NACHT, LRR and PYD domains-containing protein 5-like [Patiria miniata]|uniref:Uncharacterized protein n=1 Tax=Patiria miniata TaxID=46514 RepID=A0A914A5A2_PATMI|nr:NACHT, LRR and PYD domains-containing protein 5-like [Patiria miniata]